MYLYVGLGFILYRHMYTYNRVPSPTRMCMFKGQTLAEFAALISNVVSLLLYKTVFEFSPHFSRPPCAFMQCICT